MKLVGKTVVEEPVGRQVERDLVGRLLDAGLGQATALVIGGAPGIGKTCLWRWSGEQARAKGFRVLRAQPAAAESKLAFAALGDLLEDAIDDMLPELSVPQTRALEIAMLRRDLSDDRFDLRAVSVACLSGLRVLAQSEPVVVAVDDVQWLDSSTRRVLTFVARRSGADRVSFLLSLRGDPDGTEPLDLRRVLPSRRILQVRLGPLTVGALFQVIKAHLGTSVPRVALTRIAHTSGGNPFYAIELARTLDEAAPEGRLLADPLPLTGSVRSLVENRLEALPSTARWPCLLAAAASAPTHDLLATASTESDIADALASGILVEDRRGFITFQHPLFAAAIYDDAPSIERRRAHRRLAELAEDPEQRGRHLARATVGPDRQVARALDVAAERARRRGATDMAAELAELARELTPGSDGAERGRRGLEMSRDLLQLGDTPNARTAATCAIEEADGPTRAQAFVLIARIEWLTGSSTTALQLAERALETRARSPHRGEHPDTGCVPVEVRSSPGPLPCTARGRDPPWACRRTRALAPGPSPVRRCIRRMRPRTAAFGRRDRARPGPRTGARARTGRRTDRLLRRERPVAVRRP